MIITGAFSWWCSVILYVRKGRKYCAAAVKDRSKKKKKKDKNKSNLADQGRKMGKRCQSSDYCTACAEDHDEAGGPPAACVKADIHTAACGESYSAATGYGLKKAAAHREPE